MLLFSLFSYLHVSRTKTRPKQKKTCIKINFMLAIIVVPFAQRKIGGNFDITIILFTIQCIDREY